MRLLFCLRALFKIAFFTLTFLFFGGQHLFSQQIFPPLPIEKRPHLRAEFTSDKINIDGIADEPAWQHSAVAGHFTENYPTQGAKPSYETEVRILYDNTNIYLYVKCEFPPGRKKIQVQDLRRDFGYTDNELFEVVIDPFKDRHLPVMAFCVTPFGTQMDVMYYSDGTFDYKWDAVWKSASKIQDHSWTTEIAIPFSSLRYPPDTTEWSINFVRNIRQFGELSDWSPIPLIFNDGHTEYAGILTNIVPPRAKLNMRIEPYTLVNSTSSDKTPAQYKPHAGGELVYAVNTNTILEGTINTDFAQADADVEVINLTRSNVFFPEQRQFFLENSSLFSVGQNSIIQPFFSRRIGLSDAGVPLPIKGGLRLIHQDGNQSLGLLVMRQDGDSSQNGALFGVLRYKRNITHSFQLGGMAVIKEGLAAPGQPAYVNPVGVVDAFWRVSQPLFVRGFVSESDNTLTGQKGTAALSEFNYASNSFIFDWFETMVSKNYQAQTGFLSREDFINTQPTFGYLYHKDWFPKSIAFFNPTLTADIYHQASTGIFQEANVNLVPFQLIFNNLAQFNVNITSSWENLVSSFSPVRNVNIAAGNYHYNRYEFYGFTNQGARLSAQARISTGAYYNGSLNSYFLSLRTAPVPNFSLVMSYTREDFKHTGVDAVSTSTNLLAPELRMGLNPRLLLSAFYQYNTDAQNGSLNTRFSWEYKPLSFIYVVYNTLNNFYKTPFDIPQKQQNGILKITYIRQL